MCLTKHHSKILLLQQAHASVALLSLVYERFAVAHALFMKTLKYVTHGEKIQLNLNNIFFLNETRLYGSFESPLILQMNLVINK